MSLDLGNVAGQGLQGIPGPSGAQDAFVGHDLFVDAAVGLPVEEQTGSQAAPFATLTQAIDHLTASSDTAWHIWVAFGAYSDALAIPGGKFILIEGAVRVSSVLSLDGTITWTPTGSGTSWLAFRSIATTVPMEIAGDGAVATMSALNSSLAGFSSTGTSTFTCSIGGNTLASFGPGFSTPVVAATITGGIAMNGELLLSNVQCESTAAVIRASRIFADGCSFNQPIELSNSHAHFIGCVWYNDPATIQFDAPGGSVHLHTTSAAFFIMKNGSIANGSPLVVDNGGVRLRGPTRFDPTSGGLLDDASSPWMAFLVGSDTDSLYTPVGNGGLYAIQRAGIAGQPPTRKAFVGLCGFDNISPQNIAIDGGRCLYYGGGGWGAAGVGVGVVAATTHQFYTASAYSEDPADDALRFFINADGVRVSAAFVAEQQVLYVGSISPTVGTSQNNWAPTGLSTIETIYVNATAAISITGLTGGVDGRIITMYNAQSNLANTITLTHDATSTAANRFLCPVNTAVVIPANGCVQLQYHGASSRWRVRSGW